jgi:lysophospholipase L1-like esterase
MKRVLFQGDSITDCGRDREDFYGLGGGYAMMVAKLFGELHPNLEVEFVNRGISGDRACDLKRRWQEDCIDLKPDVLSIFIGINDVWRRYDDAKDPTSAEKFEENYRYILNETRTKLPSTKIIIMEPFVLPIPEDRKAWREDLDPKIQVARKLAYEFKATYIPLDGIFAKAYIESSPELLAGDGVHPTEEGHKLITSNLISCYDFK